MYQSEDGKKADKISEMRVEFLTLAMSMTCEAMTYVDAIEKLSASLLSENDTAAELEVDLVNRLNRVLEAGGHL